MNKYPQTLEEAKATTYGHSYKSQPYKEGLCAAEVANHDTRWTHYYQCTKKNGKGPGGLYCGTHSTRGVKTPDEGSLISVFKVRLGTTDAPKEMRATRITDANIWIFNGSRVNQERRHSEWAQYYTDLSEAIRAIRAALVSRVESYKEQITGLEEEIAKKSAAIASIDRQIVQGAVKYRKYEPLVIPDDIKI